VPRPQDPGQQDERFRRAGGEQHLAWVTAMAGGHCGHRLALVRVGREVGAADHSPEPVRRTAGPHVDGEVDKPGNQVRVTVVGQVDGQP